MDLTIPGDLLHRGRSILRDGYLETNDTLEVLEGPIHGGNGQETTNCN
jgi:hypothetical protein